MAIIQFCAMVVRNGCINDVVELKEVCIMQASRSSADVVRQIVQSQMGLVLICIWVLVVGIARKGR